MNGAGKISWTEFLAATIEAVGRVGEEEFAECFDRLDCDSSGFISTEVGQLRYTVSELIHSLKYLSLAHILTEFERDPWRLAK
jgi:Ca2+-binding EF-hand superfamily protein